MCSSSPPAPTRAGPRALTNVYREAVGSATVNRRGHFSMLIAQLVHITEIAATDWLRPNPRSPDRADSAAWIGEVVDEPHTRELLKTLLAAVCGGATPSLQPGSALDADDSSLA